MNIKLFDVTLRDGLQSFPVSQHEEFNTERKQIIYKYLNLKYSPKSLEIGSCVNKKVLPIFKDTEELFKYAENNKKHYNNPNHYILVPNQEHLFNALKFNVKNFSFITSVSNSFQLKNTKLSLEQNYNNLNNMIAILDDYSNFRINSELDELREDFTPYNIKLYVSCINECPIEGKISSEDIVKHLIHLNKLKCNKICLSDTCGTLTHDEFIDIIEKSNKNGLNINNFSLHLHVKPEKEYEVEKIVHTALDYGINEFDVSELKTGGCSVTMDKNKIAPNMNYEQYYKFIINYLIK